MKKYLLILICFNLFAQSGLIAKQNFGKKATIAYDTDAAAFLTATGIPNDGTLYYIGTAYEISGEQLHTAIQNLVVGLKNEDIWSHIKAFYPFIGGTSDTHKWNLKDPRDLDAAFRLVYVNSPIHNESGIKFNGSNNYANTFLNPSAVFSDKAVSFGFYQNIVNTLLSNDKHFMGCDTNSATNFMGIEQSGAPGIKTNYLTSSSSSVIVYGSDYKFINSNSTATTKNLTVENTSTAYTSISGNFPNLNFWLGGLNFAGGYYSGVNSGFGAAWIVTGLSDSQIVQLRSLNLSFQTALHRN